MIKPALNNLVIVECLTVQNNSKILGVSTATCWPPVVLQHYYRSHSIAMVGFLEATEHAG